MFLTIKLLNLVNFNFYRQYNNTKSIKSSDVLVTLRNQKFIEEVSVMSNEKIEKITPHV
jgi:hypothetical protein